MISRTHRLAASSFLGAPMTDEERRIYNEKKEASIKRQQTYYVAAYYVFCGLLVLGTVTAAYGGYRGVRGIWRWGKRR